MKTRSVTSIRPVTLQSGFTLVEVLLSSVLLLVIVLMVVGMINAASKTYRTMNGQVSLFQDSAVVFDNVTRNVAEATLKTYLDYYPDQALLPPPAPTPGRPERYVRNSDLHFITGPASLVLKDGTHALPRGVTVSPSHAIFFLAPLDYTKSIPSTSASPSSSPDYNNTSGLLTGCGYYVTYGENESLKIPGFTADVKKRFRLMRFFDPTEEIQTYCTIGSTWFLNKISSSDDKDLSKTYVRPFADNVIALFIEPKVTDADLRNLRNPPLSRDYVYDSRSDLNDKTGKIKPPGNQEEHIQQHQLPPLLHMTMVVIDDASADRLARLSDDTITQKLFAEAPFTSTLDYDKDMAQLNDNLVKQRVNYRVFSSDVPLRGAKWSPQ